MNKEHDRLMGTILVFLICVVAVIWGTQDGEVPAAAQEQSNSRPAKGEW